MSLPKRYLNADLLQRLAADWLTGGLSPAAQRRAQLLLEQSPAFAQAVRDWRERFDAALLSSPQLGRPSESVWQGITARIGAAQESSQQSVASVAAGWSVRAWRRLSLLLGGVAVAAAFAVGVGLAFVDVNIWVAAAAIGLATMTMVTIGVMLGRVLGTMFGKRAEIVGGVVLMIVGATILYEHLSV